MDDCVGMPVSGASGTLAVLGPLVAVELAGVLADADGGVAWILAEAVPQAALMSPAPTANMATVTRCLRLLGSVRKSALGVLSARP